MDRPPPFPNFSARPPQQPLPGPLGFGSFQGSEQRNQGSLQQGRPAAAGFWPGQNAYFQQTPPATPGNQGFGTGQAEWAGFSPGMAPGRQDQGYAPQIFQQQGYSSGNHKVHAGKDFDPTEPGQFHHSLDDDSSRGVGIVPRMGIEYRQQQQALPERPGTLWQQGVDVSGGHRPQTHMGGLYLDQSYPEPSSYSRTRSTLYQPGASGPDPGMPFQRPSSFSDDRRANYGPTAHDDQWQTGQNPTAAEMHHRSQEGGFAWDVRPPGSDEESIQRHQDEQWLTHFLLKRRKVTKSSSPTRAESSPSVSEVRQVLYSAVRLVSHLSLACRQLQQQVGDDSRWSESYAKAVAMKTELQEKLKFLTDSDCIEKVKKKLEVIHKERARQRQKNRQRLVEMEEEEARAAQREAAIDKWRMKRIHEVEEKKREQELKAAADSVLSEVRKKQADTKRMVDILNSLEKLRKLRKEAAARKGIFPEKEADEIFDGHLARLRKLIGSRTSVYDAEEKALRVMLEGEQEEERKREQERRQKKDKEKLLQKKQELEAMLFGQSVEMHPEHPLKPFRQYYLQAEHSLHALIQIRREWDRCLVPADHPDGSFIPQGWVLPEPPSDEVWATSLDKAD